MGGILEVIMNKLESMCELPVLNIRNMERLSLTKQANAAQRKWMTDITDYVNEYGLGDLYGHEYEGCTNIQRHHVVGRTAKHNKIHIGHWFVIPVPYELHEPNLKHQFHVGHSKKAFVKRFGNQRDIYEQLVVSMENAGYDVPPLVNHYAILETSA